MARKGKPPPAAVSPTQPQTPLAKARWYMEAGDVRRARALAAEAARTGPESERPDAEALLRRLGPDMRAIAVAAGVLVLIILAAWLAILRSH
jgi:FimV-like protein